MKRTLPFIIAVLAVIVPMMFTHSCANTTKAPTGGDKDTIPPILVDIKPLPGATGVPVHGAKFYFEFNEYVTIKQATNIFLSPPLAKPVKSKIRGRGVQVWFEEDLQPETTYTISFTGAIADNNEGNLFPGYTYVFSTGSQIDSMMVTGTVRDCNTLKPVKDATVLLYKNHADSAIFLERPYAATKTDDWGYFRIPYVKDTLYRLYALKDDGGNNIYDPDVDLVGFVDSLIRPVLVAHDTIPEMMQYEMDDTLGCQGRRSEYDIKLFREKPTKQFLKNSMRTGTRSAYVTFQAPGVWIDSLWVRGYKADRLITQFNILQDSLELWVNDRRPAPDTLHVFVNYRKTDSLGKFQPSLEHLRLVQEGAAKNKYKSRKDIKHEDTTCVFKLTAPPETVEQTGFDLMFDRPLVWESFDSLKLRCINPRQKESLGAFTVSRDTLNPRHYTIMSKDKLQVGWDYILKVPHRAFRDIDGFWSDSTEVKVTLPTDESLSTIMAICEGVDRKIIVDLLGEKRDKVLRSYIIDRDCTLAFPYLKAGKYSIRITDDGNRNSIVDTGSLLEHRQPEKVLFLEVDGDTYIAIPASSEVEQHINVNELFR